MNERQAYHPTILVTGASGMIGSRLVKALLDKKYRVIGMDRIDSGVVDSNYTHVVLDLSNREAIDQILNAHPVTHTIHLAALAHFRKGESITEETFYQANVINAVNVFECCKSTNILFISTVDVFGFVKGPVNGDSKIEPITPYGRTKAQAERELSQIADYYNIYRLSPVYSEENKRDIEKRYYLKHPDWAYIIGAGSQYEVLHIDNAVNAMIEWIEIEPDGKVHIIKDEKLMDTVEVLKKERESGNAKHIIRFPRWIVVAGYWVARITGKNKYTYLLNKALYPLRSS